MSIDLGRFEASICSIVRALFYFESDSRAKLLDDLIVVWPALKEWRGLTKPEIYQKASDAQTAYKVIIYFWTCANGRIRGGVRGPR